MAYIGSSIVDYLNSVGQDSSQQARAKLAAQYGISNYNYSADQNSQLLNALRNQTSQTPTTNYAQTLGASYSNPLNTPTNAGSSMITDFWNKAGVNQSTPVSQSPVTPVVNSYTPPTYTTPTTQTSSDKATLLANLQQQLASAQSQLQTAQADKAAGTGTYAPVDQSETTDVQSILDKLNTSAGTTGGDYRTQMMNLLSGLTTQQNTYLDTLKNLPTAAEQYSTYREQLGLPASEQALTTTNVQVQKTQGLIDQLEKDINSRISGRMVTNAARNRELAVEQKPLSEQLTNLTRLAGIQSTGVQTAKEQLAQMLGLAQQDRTTQEAIAKAPLEMTQSLIPTLSSLAQYQSPQEELAAAITKENLLKQLGLGDYAKSASISDTYGTGSIGEYNFYAAQEKAAGRTPMGYNEYQTLDANRKAKAAGAGAGGLTINQQIDAEMSLYSKVQTANKLNTEILRNVGGVNSLWSAYIANPKSVGLNTTSQAIITSYGKILDPGSVVRESEYARSPEGASLLNAALGKLERMKKGGAGLTVKDLEAFVNAINVLGKNAQNEVNSQINVAKQYGEKYGLDTSLLGGVIQDTNTNTNTGAGDINSQIANYQQSHPGENTFFFEDQYGNLQTEVNVSDKRLKEILSQGYTRI